MAKNNDSSSFEDWTTKKLKDEAKSYHQTIYEIECYSTKDLMNLDGILNELSNRGIDPINKLSF